VPCQAPHPLAPHPLPAAFSAAIEAVAARASVKPNSAPAAAQICRWSLLQERKLAMMMRFIAF